MSTQQAWTVPPELADFEQYTNYPGRSEELANRNETVFVNAPVAIMRAETTAQWALLQRLHKAGLLKTPEDT